MIPTDGSELSRVAVDRGVAFASSIGARVTLLTASVPFHVVAVDPMMVTDTKESYMADAEAAGRKRLDRGLESARTMNVPCEAIHVFNGDPYRAIIETAEARGCDLIVMASHGRKGAAALLLGSETQKVLAHCRLPVLVWR